MATSSVSSSSSGSTLSVSGLGSGLNIQDIVDGLINVEKTTQNKLKSSLSAHQTKVNAYQALNSSFANIKNAVQDLALGINWKTKVASSSSPNVTASATGTAQASSFTFSVQNLAAANTKISANSVSSLDQVVGGGVSLSGSASALGLTNLNSTNLSTGSHALNVTQSSAGAKVTSNNALAGSTTIAAGTTFSVKVNGTVQDLAINAGTYTPAELAAQITSKANGTFTASVDASNKLVLTTANEGVSNTIQVQGQGNVFSTTNSKFGFTYQASGTTAGVNGTVTLDGVSTSIDPSASGSATINGASGQSLQATVGPLRAGSSTISAQNNAGRTMNQMIEEINGDSTKNYTAAAVQVSPGNYKLQLTAKQTGVANAITDNSNAYGSGLGGFNTVQAAQDASIQVGSGAGAYSISSSTNTLTDVTPGLTLTLSKADPTLPITVGVSADSNGMADKVSKMVDSVNSAIKLIRDNSKYDASTSSAGLFLGNSTARRLNDTLHTAISNLVGGTGANGLKLMSDVGITSNADGSFSFDRTKFTTAYTTNPENVAGLFVSGGTTGTTSTTNPGIAERVLSMTKLATDSVSGWITTAIKGETTTIGDLNKAITAWDDRLAKRRQTLLTQYTAMDTAVARFNALGSSLAGSISGLLTSYN